MPFRDFGRLFYTLELLRNRPSAFDRFLRPWDIVPSELAPIVGGEKGATINKDGFKVSLDMPQFQPDEISVKTVDNVIQIEAKHEKKDDDLGYVSRHFVRHYALPREINIKEVVSTLSSDGVLTIKAPAQGDIGEMVRPIQIQQTGPAKEITENKPATETDNEKKK